MIDTIFYHRIYQRLSSYLANHPVDHVIDTQPMGSRAIINACRDFSLTLRVEKVLTEIVEDPSCYFTKTIQRLTPEEKRVIYLRVFDPRSSIKWGELCGVSMDQVLRERPPIREAFFQKSVYRNKQLKLEIAQEQESLLKQLPYLKERVCLTEYDVGPVFEKKTVTIILGANSSHRAIIDYFNSILEFFSHHRLFDEVNCLIYCPFIHLQQELIEHYNRSICKSRLFLYPFSIQKASVIAKLFYHSDLTITKSGGLTSMELATIRKKPMLIHKVEQLPSWEEGNAQYLIRHHNANFVSAETLYIHLKRIFQKSKL